MRAEQEADYLRDALSLLNSWASGGGGGGQGEAGGGLQFPCMLLLTRHAFLQQPMQY